MAKRDYYDVLGLKRDASADQIRSAYRKAARKFHPDVSKAPDAADKFKEATAAYEVLSDPQKRQAYDRFGFAGPGGGPFGGGRPGGRTATWQGPQGVSFDFEDLFGGGGRGGRGGFGGMGLEEILEALSGGGRARGRRASAERAPVRGEDVAHDLWLDFLEAARGTSASLRLQRETGQTETLRVRIPPGVHEGQRIRLAGKGPGGGDLYIVVHVREHPYFRRDGGDIYLDLPVSVAEAVLGATIEVPTLDGPTKLKIPPCSGSRTLRLRGLGVPSPGGEGRGDQYVVLKVVAPPAISEQGAKLIRQFQETEKHDPRKDMPWKR